MAAARSCIMPQAAAAAMDCPTRVFGAVPSSAAWNMIYNNKEVDLEGSTQQTAQRHSPTVSREIHVSGTAEICCPADRGSVRITLSNSKESVDDVTNSITRRIDYILQTLRQHNVKDEDISVRRNLHREDDLYHMNAEATASFSDQEKMEKVCNVLLEKLDKSVCVGQPQFYHSAECLSQLRTSACVTAVENAQQKASKVCHLLKQSLGPPLQLREEETKEWKSEEEEEEERDRNLGGATQTRTPRRPTVTVFSRVSATFSLRQRDRQAEKS